MNYILGDYIGLPLQKLRKITVTQMQILTLANVSDIYFLFYISPFFLNFTLVNTNYFQKDRK